MFLFRIVLLSGKLQFRQPYIRVQAGRTQSRLAGRKVQLAYSKKKSVHNKAVKLVFKTLGKNSMVKNSHSHTQKRELENSQGRTLEDFDEDGRKGEVYIYTHTHTRLTLSLQFLQKKKIIIIKDFSQSI